MVISGLQKLTLLDFPNHVACTVFFQGCNFRCPFCQNKDLVLENEPIQAITNEEFFNFLKTRKGFLDGVCITGGEPLIHDDIDNFIKEIKQMGLKVKLDTNGFNPKKLKQLVLDGLVDYVAMDVKNSLANYALTTGCKKINLDNIMESINFLLEGTVDYEFRTTVVKEFHKKTDFIEISKMLKGCKKYFLQGFQDSDTCIKRGLHAYKKEELEEFVKLLKENGISAEIRGVSE